MNAEQEQAKHEPFDLPRLVRGLSLSLDPGAKPQDALDLLVQEAHAAVGCDHLFLSRYEAAGRTFRAVAWRSSVDPGDVPLERKFMGNSYFSGQPVIVHDLSQYNYRLRPGAARLCLMSMVGVPLVTGQGVIGVLEAFAERSDHFSDLDADLLALFARQATAIIERADCEREAKYRAAENEFLVEALKLEQASLGSLFYKVGETFAAVLGVDGIAVFGIEPALPDGQLQEVMARGFSMADIGRLKTLYGKERLQKLLPPPGGGRKDLIVKQAFRQGGAGAAKLLYTVPLVYRDSLQGLIVFHWRQLDKAADHDALENFIERTIGHLSMLLGRKDVYATIQRIGFYDLLTGLANRRMFDYVLDREIKKMWRTAKPLSLLMIDVDNFKAINDIHGHPAGDAVLQQLGAIIRDSFRSVDLTARYGGEEFAVILPDTDRVRAVSVAERMRLKVSESQFPVGKGFINVTVSIGGATWTNRDAADEATGERLVTAADQALYKAKQMGRDITIFAND
ncbi:diguanylate cyclase [Anaeroselena agilis]|uniref:Sensor domain-containing diguanylate cyclase n=1 Tax=Anaeroselena agilis TaxID=3063788 RepID=A0ABU3P0C1_9FIRM|nr:sensor domain-containing diguanylate cyclase [Selenomonadales bacterium 4137-cl]